MTPVRMKQMKAILKKTPLLPVINKYKQWELARQKNAVRSKLMDQYLPKDGIGAELGVLWGEFSKTLFHATRARELHLIDPWYFLDAHWPWHDGNNSTVDALCKILQTHKKEINEKRIFVHVQDDIKVLAGFPDGYFDWVYIDSSHAYQHTVDELQLLAKKVKPSGVICGDDWQPDSGHRHHGVYKAVNEFMVRYNYELIYANVGNLQWFIQKAR